MTRVVSRKGEPSGACGGCLLQPGLPRGENQEIEANSGADGDGFIIELRPVPEYDCEVIVASRIWRRPASAPSSRLAAVDHLAPNHRIYAED
jgi:hypothetical protein